jgi:hypothetical protein
MLCACTIEGDQQLVASDAGAAPGFNAGGKPMKRSRIIFFVLVVLLVVLAFPAFARADVPAPTGWTWDETPPIADGWTWD